MRSRIQLLKPELTYTLNRVWRCCIHFYLLWILCSYSITSCVV